MKLEKEKYLCSQCAASYTTKSSLEDHVNTVHENIRSSSRHVFTNFPNTNLRIFQVQIYDIFRLYYVIFVVIFPNNQNWEKMTNKKYFFFFNGDILVKKPLDSYLENSWKHVVSSILDLTCASIAAKVLGHSSICNIISSRFILSELTIAKNVERNLPKNMIWGKIKPAKNFRSLYLLFWPAFIWQIFLEKKNSAGYPQKTKWLMKKLNIVIWWDNLCAFENTNFLSANLFLEGSQLNFSSPKNLSNESRPK